MPSIHYRVSFDARDAHLIDVTLRIDRPEPSGQRLSLPNWIPGSYKIRDFSRHIVTIDAVCLSKDGQASAVALAKCDKSTWQAPAGLERLEVRYRVYAWDLSVRAAHLDRRHAFFNGTSVFLAVDGQIDDPVDVLVVAPTMRDERSWRVATAMDPVDIDEAGFGRYGAADYDELIDHPFEIGAHQRIDFAVCGVPHAVVLTDAAPFDADRLRDDLVRICEHHVRFFGEPAPMPRYLFLTMLVDAGYGGLEHRASTALLATRSHLPEVGAAPNDDKYVEFLGLCSHEYFHTWNVKRIKPAQFVPYHLATESYTRLLWFFEGVTSYYDDLALVRCGLIDRDRYTQLLSRTITRVQRGAGRLTQSVTDSSFDAWNKFYQQDENAPNAVVSYYAKGALIALCLDARLRQATAGRITLDTLMAVLWARWLEDGAGLDEDEPERVALELIGDARIGDRSASDDLSGFFRQALYSTDELPLDSALQTLGAGLAWRTREGATDAGGTGGSPVGSPVSSDGLDEHSRWLGATLVAGAAGATVKIVLSDGPAERAGLAAGDRLVAIDDLTFDAGDIDAVLRRYPLGETVRVHHVRLGRLLQSSLVIEAAPRDTAVVALAAADGPSDWLDDPRADA